MRPNIDEIKRELAAADIAFYDIDAAAHIESLLDWCAELEQSLAAYELDGELAAQRHLVRIAELEAEIARLAPFLALHGVGSYTIRYTEGGTLENEQLRADVTDLTCRLRRAEDMRDGYERALAESRAAVTELIQRGERTQDYDWFVAEANRLPAIMERALAAEAENERLRAELAE